MSKPLIITLLAIVAACAPAEPEKHTTSLSVNLARTSQLLGAMDVLLDNRIDVAALEAMTQSVPMDEEKQQVLSVTFNGASTELFYHVWREQIDWVHLYLSSPSEGLIDAINLAATDYVLPATGDH